MTVPEIKQGSGYEKSYLIHGVSSWSGITPCIKIVKPLAVYILSNIMLYVMMP